MPNANKTLIWFVAIMYNPQDGLNQQLVILDASGLQSHEGAKSKCTVLQRLEIESKYSGPHLLGVDKHTGDIYAALVSDTPLSTVLRFKHRGCTRSVDMTSLTGKVGAHAEHDASALLGSSNTEQGEVRQHVESSQFFREIGPALEQSQASQ